MECFQRVLSGSANQEITYDKFIEMVDKGEVTSKVVQESDKLIITPEIGTEDRGIQFNYTVVL